MREDQVVCNKCNGEGAIHGKNFKEISFTCSKCDGAGILDWIENIMGKPHRQSDILFANPDGAVDLYYEGNKILQTTEDGGIKFFSEV
jgi:excinuclease UvrABC ATPase subunit